MKIIPLKRLATVDISNVDKKSKDEESHVLLCNFVDVYHNWAITEDLSSNFMHATANKNQIERFLIKKGQVAITKDSEKRNDIGLSTYIADDIKNCVLGYHCALITPNNNELRGKYLNIVFNSPYAQKYFEMNASGSGQRFSLSKQVIEDFPVPIPDDITIQDNFGDLCSNIDLKINNNKNICSNLKAISRLLYDYWFLQFDYPNEEGKPYKTSGGSMKWNEVLKREIPEGWKVGKISDLGKVVGGATPSTSNKEYYVKNGIGWITPNDLSNTEDKYIAHGERDITNEAVDSCSTVLMPKGTVLISSRAPIGYLAIASDTLCTNQGFKSVVPNGYSSEFIYQTLRVMMPYIKQYGAGSKFAEVSADELANMSVLLPDTTIEKKYYQKIKSIEEQVLVFEEENRQLISLRNFLLPLLMNGQVRIEKRNKKS